MSRINFRKHTFSLRETDPRVYSHQGYAKNAAHFCMKKLEGKEYRVFYLKKKQNKYH